MRLPPGPQDHLVFNTLVGSLESVSAAARPFSSPHQVPFSPHVAKTLLMFTSPSGSPGLCTPGAGSPPSAGVRAGQAQWGFLGSGSASGLAVLPSSGELPAGSPRLHPTLPRQTVAGSAWQPKAYAFQAWG